MRLAIVGSRILWANREACYIICQQLEMQKPSLVISGGALGVDKMAEWIAKYVYKIPTLIFYPLVEGTVAYMKRDLQIAEECDRLLLIEGRETKTHGARWTADKAAKAGKGVVEFIV